MKFAYIYFHIAIELQMGTRINTKFKHNMVISYFIIIIMMLICHLINVLT